MRADALIAALLSTAAVATLREESSRLQQLHADIAQHRELLEHCAASGLHVHRTEWRELVRAETRLLADAQRLMLAIAAIEEVQQ